MHLKNSYVLFLYVFLGMSLTSQCLAQDLDPKRWSHLPTEMNFAGGGYAFTRADICFDPVLRLENVEMEMNTWVLKYIRTFAFLQKSARVEFAQGFNEGSWKGLVDGIPSSIKRSGLSDSFMRFAINLLGSPPLKGKEYAVYRAGVEKETLAGIALAVQLPTGDYMDNKLINLGTNRFTFGPQLGLEHTRGKWSMEVTGSVWLFTDNDEFYKGKKLEQNPLYTAQIHLVHTFRPGIWTGVSLGYVSGGESILNGVEKHDRKESLGCSFSLNYPIAKQVGLKVAYVSTRTQESVGFDSDSMVLGFSGFW